MRGLMGACAPWTAVPGAARLRNSSGPGPCCVLLVTSIPSHGPRKDYHGGVAALVQAAGFPAADTTGPAGGRPSHGECAIFSFAPVCEVSFPVPTEPEAATTIPPEKATCRRPFPGEGPGASGPGARTGRKLFVGNLNFDTTSDDLKELFSTAWLCESAHAMTDRATGRPPRS